MTISVLTAVTRLRQRLDDFGGDTNTNYWQTSDAGCLWKNDELVTYLNEAQKETCRRHPIVDSTSDLCSITLVADTATYDLDPLILAVERAYVNGADEVLIKRNYRDDIDSQSYEEPDETLYYVEDGNLHSLTLIAAPTASGTLVLTVKRLPLEDLTWRSAAAAGRVYLELDDLFFEDLLLYATYLAFSKRDTDTLNLEAANTAMERFRSRVGDPVNLKLLAVRKDVANKPLRTSGYYY
jgi:hypothetical protein